MITPEQALTHKLTYSLHSTTFKSIMTNSLRWEFRLQIVARISNLKFSRMSMDILSQRQKKSSNLNPINCHNIYTQAPRSFANALVILSLKSLQFHCGNEMKTIFTQYPNYLNHILFCYHFRSFSSLVPQAV